MSSKTKSSPFSELILGLSAVAMHYLGETSISVSSSSTTHKKQESSAKVVNLELAKQNIDFIAVLSQKTQGNLTSDEREILDSALEDLQLRYASKLSQRS